MSCAARILEQIEQLSPQVLPPASARKGDALARAVACGMRDVALEVLAFPADLLRRPSTARTARCRTRAAAEESNNLAKAAAAAGLVANPVVLVSEYFLKTTGEGLPPGPGGIYGATEGVSYLVIVGIVAWSLYTKVKTGSGLQGSLLGAVEGLSYLSIVAGETTFGATDSTA